MLLLCKVMQHQSRLKLSGCHDCISFFIFYINCSVYFFVLFKCVCVCVYIHTVHACTNNFKMLIYIYIHTHHTHTHTHYIILIYFFYFVFSCFKIHILGQIFINYLNNTTVHTHII